jgi:hypothetical protein
MAFSLDFETEACTSHRFYVSEESKGVGVRKEENIHVSFQVLAAASMMMTFLVCCAVLSGRTRLSCQFW